jgi:copper(I)-binding protein
MKTVALLLPMALLGACAPSVPARIEVEDSFARPGAAGHGVAYVTLRNDGGKDDALRGVEIEDARASVHESSMADGVMRMRPLPRLDIPAGQTVPMAPGAVHIMLSNLKQPLRRGDDLRLTLLFRQSPPVRTTVPVQ